MTITNAIAQGLPTEDLFATVVQARAPVTHPNPSPSPRTLTLALTLTFTLALTPPPAGTQEVISLLNCDRATMWLLTPNRDKLWSMVAPVGQAVSLIRLEAPTSPNPEPRP